MNTEFSIKYLTGGDDSFGPNYGGATVYTLTRAGYENNCPNVYKLLQNLKFDLGEGKRLDGRYPGQARGPGRK